MRKLRTTAALMSTAALFMAGSLMAQTTSGTGGGNTRSMNKQERKQPAKQKVKDAKSWDWGNKNQKATAPSTKDKTQQK